MDLTLIETELGILEIGGTAVDLTLSPVSPISIEVGGSGNSSVIEISGAARGENGLSFYHGHGDPPVDLIGRNNETYLNVDNGDVFGWQDSVGLG